MFRAKDTSSSWVKTTKKLGKEKRVLVLRVIMLGNRIYL